MSIGIAIIGAGVMGADHARTFAREIAGTRLVAISDADLGRAEAVAAETGATRGVNDPLGVINDPAVGAVVIASPDTTHAEFVLACLKAGKPVLCEKPLSPSVDECLAIIAAETERGRQLVQVGFMRRFDPSYVEMKATLHGGTLGAALMLHCVHRNASVSAGFTPPMSITASAVHEIDIARWLLSAEITNVQVFKPKPSSLAKISDPLLVVFETDKGILVDVELFLTAQYGYDVRGELVCERGTVSMAPPVLSEIRGSGVNSFGFAADWRPRFASAYRLQMQAWIASLSSGTPVGASAWDGYVATAVANAGVRALATGKPEPVKLVSKPALYA